MERGKVFQFYSVNKFTLSCSVSLSIFCFRFVGLINYSQDVADTPVGDREEEKKECGNQGIEGPLNNNNPTDRIINDYSTHLHYHNQMTLGPEL